MYGNLSRRQLGRRILGSGRRPFLGEFGATTYFHSQARRKSTGLDPDLVAYIDYCRSRTLSTTSNTGAVSIFPNSRVIYCLNELFKGLKGEGIWTNYLVAAWPFPFHRIPLSSNAAHYMNSINIKAPNTGDDTTLQFQSAAILHDPAFGVKNASSSLVPSFNPRTRLGNFDWHFLFYGAMPFNDGVASASGYTQSGTGAVAMGFDFLGVTYDGNGLSVTYSTKNFNNIWVATRTSSTLTTLYRNGISVASNTTSVSTQLPISTIGFMTGVSGAYTNPVHFVACGKGLPDGIAKSYADIVQIYCSRMGRI